MNPTATPFLPKVLSGLARRQRMIGQGLPATLVPMGKLFLDDSLVLECPYSALTFRPKAECPHCVVERMLLVKVAGKRLVTIGLADGPLAAKLLSVAVLNSHATN